MSTFTFLKDHFMGAGEKFVNDALDLFPVTSWLSFWIQSSAAGDNSGGPRKSVRQVAEVAGEDAGARPL